VNQVLAPPLSVAGFTSHAGGVVSAAAFVTMRLNVATDAATTAVSNRRRRRDMWAGLLQF
jgi:hypothetical protein